jgi:hypothetical protein
MAKSSQIWSGLLRNYQKKKAVAPTVRTRRQGGGVGLLQNV